VKYLDATVFLSAALDPGRSGSLARELLARVQHGESQAATSALTYDEIFWVVKKYRGFDAALRASKTLLDFPNLEIFPVDVEVLEKAHALAAKYKLNPRDAIHAASAVVNGIQVLISEDRDFDKVKEIRRSTS